MKALPWVATLAAAIAAAGSVVLVSGNSSAFAADTPPPLEEDFVYPGAALIEQQHGLKLFKGDGHIQFDTSVDLNVNQCAPGEIQVEKHLDVDPYLKGYCFKTSGKKGWVTLEVPATFGIRGGAKPVEATAKVPGAADEKFQIPANTSVPIHPGDDNHPPVSVLVELRFG